MVLDIKIRQFEKDDIKEAIEIWNEIFWRPAFI